MEQSTVIAKESSPFVLSFDMEDSGKEKKARQHEIPVAVESHKRVYAVIVVLAVLTAFLLIAVISLCIAFSVEIANLKSEIESQGLTEQQQQLMQELNSSLEMLSQQQLQADSDTNGRVNSLSQQVDDVQMQVSQQVNDVQMLADQTVSHLEMLGSLETFPAPSCANIFPSLPSGYYWVSASNGSAVRVFCDMSLTCGNVTGGWTRVAQQNFSNIDEPCPSGFSERMDSGIRTCDTDSAGCTSIDYSTFDISYSSVCGKVVAYQFGAPEAFEPLVNTPSLTIDPRYLDGISLTHGQNPRQHIWSFAAGAAHVLTNLAGCPCNTGSTVSVMDTFVGTDYFCDTAATSLMNSVFLPDDPLWDGAGCRAQSMDCCSLNTPPWFHRQLPQPTSDDIEIRACRFILGGTPIESFEFYVQ